MNTRTAKIKKHISEHPVLYVAGASTFTGVIFGVLIAQDPTRVIQVISGKNNVLNAKVVKSVNMIVVDFKPNRIGHPGYMVYCDQTKQLFRTQGDAAKALSLAPSALSKHLNGRTAHLNGLTFRRLK